jgi:hypothetical protein
MRTFQESLELDLSPTTMHKVQNVQELKPEDEPHRRNVSHCSRAARDVHPSFRFERAHVGL